MEVEGTTTASYVPMSDGHERHYRTATVPFSDDNEFASNRISTAKYNALSFLPLNLFEQCEHARIPPSRPPRGGGPVRSRRHRSSPTRLPPCTPLAAGCAASPTFILS